MLRCGRAWVIGRPAGPDTAPIAYSSFSLDPMIGLAAPLGPAGSSVTTTDKATAVFGLSLSLRYDMFSVYSARHIF